jgi:hypothetical protein
VDNACLPSPAVVLIAMLTKKGNLHSHPTISQWLCCICAAMGPSKDMKLDIDIENFVYYDFIICLMIPLFPCRLCKALEGKAHKAPADKYSAHGPMNTFWHGTGLLDRKKQISVKFLFITELQPLPWRFVWNSSVPQTKKAVMWTNWVSAPLYLQIVISVQVATRLYPC